MSIRLRKFSKITLKEVVEERYKIKDEKLRAIIYSYWHLEGMSVPTVPYLFYVVATKMLENGVYIPNAEQPQFVMRISKQLKKTELS